MGIEIFENGRSDRGARLWNVIKDKVKSGTTVLDIGCGNAPLAEFAFAAVPDVHYTGFDSDGITIAKLKLAYPAGKWTRHVYPDIFDKELLGYYDVVVHIGIDREEYSPICHIHDDIIKAGHWPGCVLVESGFSENYDGPFVAYCKAASCYLLAGYQITASGGFEFNVAGHHLKERRWSLLERPVRDA